MNILNDTAHLKLVKIVNFMNFATKKPIQFTQKFISTDINTVNNVKQGQNFKHFLNINDVKITNLKHSIIYLYFTKVLRRILKISD